MRRRKSHPTFFAFACCVCERGLETMREKDKDKEMEGRVQISAMCDPGG